MVQDLAQASGSGAHRMNAAAYREVHRIVLDAQHFNVEAAHSLSSADGEHQPLHGHACRAELQLHAALGDASLIADFIAIKPLFKAACDALEQRTLLPTDNAALHVVHAGPSASLEWRSDIACSPHADAVLVIGDTTSSEALAQHRCGHVLNNRAKANPALRLERIVMTVSEPRDQAARCARTWGPGALRPLPCSQADAERAPAPHTLRGSS
jgi:hypothetical protein